MKYNNCVCFGIFVIFAMLIFKNKESFENNRCIDTKLSECTFTESDKEKLEDAFDFVSKPDYKSVINCLEDRKALIPGEGCLSKAELQSLQKKEFKKDHPFLGMFV